MRRSSPSTSSAPSIAPDCRLEKISPLGSGTISTPSLASAWALCRSGHEVALYEQGVRAMYRARWAEAVRCFAEVSTTSDELYYDPFDYEIDANVHSVWRRMRWRRTPDAARSPLPRWC